MEIKNQTGRKNEIITLILADMRNRKLLMGLEATGLSTDDFNTNLADLIFSKMEVSKGNEIVLYNWYEDAMYELLNVDLNKFRQNQLFLATQLYDTLEKKKMQLHKVLLVKPGKTFSFLHWIGLKGSDN